MIAVAFMAGVTITRNKNKDNEPPQNKAEAKAHR